MKKILIGITAVVLIMCLVACNNNERPAENVPTNATETQASNSNENETQNQIIIPPDYPIDIVFGKWQATQAIDMDWNEVDLSEIFGSAIREYNELILNDDMTYVNNMGVTGDGNESGKYEYKEGNLILTDKEKRKRIFLVDPITDSLEESIDEITVTYKKIN